MFKRALIAGVAVALLMSLSPLSAFAQDDMKKDKAMKKAEKTEAAHMHAPVANTIAVCGCGMVFMTDEDTPYLEVNGKSYACCTEQCHEMASAAPEKAAEMAEANTAKWMAQMTAEKEKKPEKSEKMDKEK